MQINPEHIGAPGFRKLIAEDGWMSIGQPEQGLDGRNMVEKDGVIFSAYQVPRGGSHYGTVALSTSLESVGSSDIRYELDAKELAARLQLSVTEDDMFLVLNKNFAKMSALMHSHDFASERDERHRKLLEQRQAMST